MGKVNKHCDVCGHGRPSSLVSSRIAPFTYGICDKCAEKGAESIGVISVWLATYGGADAAPDFCKKLVSWIDGEYRGWEIIRDYYNSNEQQILASFNEEFELVDDVEDTGE